MVFLELVRKRRSIRKYSSRKVPSEVLQRCLEASRLSPSACNSQPWFFVVIMDDLIRKKAAEAAFSGIYSMNSFAKDAPVLVAVVRERSKYIASLGGYFRGTQYSLIDIGIACEHFILQATEEGLGTCWIGFFNERRLKKVLGLSKRKKIDIIISMGYPEEESSYVKKKKSLKEISRII